jgi:hypothetical protein
MQTMPSDDEPVKHEVKQYNAMLSKEELMRHEVKQYKPCSVMMNQRTMKLNNANHE